MRVGIVPKMAAVSSSAHLIWLKMPSKLTATAGVQSYLSFSRIMTATHPVRTNERMRTKHQTASLFRCCWSSLKDWARLQSGWRRREHAKGVGVDKWRGKLEKKLFLWSQITDQLQEQTFASRHISAHFAVVLGKQLAPARQSLAR